MKLANLTLAQCVFVAAALSVTGCDSGDGSGDAESGSSGPTSDDTGESDDTTASSSSGGETSASSDTDPTDTTEDTTAGETTGPPPEGLGCDPPPACDKGEYEGTLTVETQADIDEIAGYTSITGRLAVAESDVECLTFLSCMESVGHDLSIFDNNLLTDVRGLDNITEIGAVTDGPLMPGGTLTVSENDALVDFDSLNLIEQTPLSLSISANTSLTSISGLQGMVGTRENFEIRFNPVLTTIGSPGLRDLLFIGGECVVTNNESLCISVIEDMCSIGIKQGPFGGSTVNNDNSC